MPDFSFSYSVVKLSQLVGRERQLVDSAISATHNSYAPYSQFNVGAALRLGDDQIVIGTNQENVSYPCGICAERTALNYAQSMYPTLPVEMIAIAAMQDGELALTPPYPCGLCRQALVEVERRQQSPIRLMLVASDEVVDIPSASCLLPFAFKM